MEKRMDAMLQSVKTIRLPLEAFYATISDEQKARLDSPPRRGRFWREPLLSGPSRREKPIDTP
jgi:hypothetical protein